MNKQEWKREWRRQRIERRDLQSSRSDDAHDSDDDFTDDDRPGYEQFLSAVIILVGIGILLVVAAIGAWMAWGFELVLKGILILALIAVGLFVLSFMANFLEDTVESIRSWSGWPYAAILLFVTTALVVWIFWGWGGILGIGIFVVLAFVILYSRPPWPF